MFSAAAEPKGLDILIGELKPIHERKCRRDHFRRILASIQVVGLIEPLCVYKEKDHYSILDGVLRHKACIELKINSVPCLVFKTKEAYSFNRMVNRLSAVQEHRMLMKALKTLDKKTVSRALGVSAINTRLRNSLLIRLHPETSKALDNGKIQVSCAETLAFVKPERQQTILKEMTKTGDMSAAFARALVMRTPVQLRAKLGTRQKTPWNQEDKKKLLVASFNETVQRYDFFAKLYQQYAIDLMKLYIYVRKLLTNERARAFIESSHPEILKLFNTIIFKVGDVNARSASNNQGAVG
jgi:hypothetical protein